MNPTLLSDSRTFHHADVAEILSNATEAGIDEAPFGVIGLKPPGAVCLYNRYEQRLAGLLTSDVLHRDFFVDVAPCTNNFMVRERFIAAWERGEPLDQVIPYTFSYRMKTTQVQLRLLVQGDQSWLLVNVPG